ncbi:MAG: helix-hairpin-helix domain-containing protein, partial [Deltaproteobacteria bacterium]|nr:helix-hairpin-helix domain-containing protein [Deltaproteobacteria bacterium]
EVVKVIIKEAERSLEVIVPDDQLSLAIGRKGQNVRLAAHLTGWNVDVYSETKIEEFSNRCKKVLTQVLGFDESTATVFYVHGFRTFEDVAKVDWKTFAELPGVGAEKLKEIRAKAEKAVADGIKTETLTAVLAKEDEQRKAIEAAKKAEEEAALRQAQDDAKKAEEEAKKAEEAGAEKPEEEKPAEEKIV